MAKILIVEDEENIRETIVDILEAFDFDVVEAENGLIGSIKAVKEKPDLIVSDVNMPEMDGFEMLDALKGCMNNAVMPPFIFLTAKVERDDQRKGMNLGADDYITKPFDKKELIDAINSKLEKQHSESEKIKSQERSEISSELHDSVQQLLVGALMGFQGISDRLGSLSSEDQVVFKSALNILRQANQDLRSYAHEIEQRQNITDIKASLEELIDNLKNTTSIDWSLSLDILVPVEQQTQTHLFRITQESINNILKHANAQKVTIALEIVDTGITLNVEDDGAGFEVETAQKSGGFTSLIKRAENLGASLDIDSQPGQGTRIKVQL